VIFLFYQLATPSLFFGEGFCDIGYVDWSSFEVFWSPETYLEKDFSKIYF
jgi:hypothetical protein